MMDDSSKEDGGTAGSHLLHLISRAAPRILGAAWVVAEAAVRRVADVIQAVRGSEAPPPALPAHREIAPSQESPPPPRTEAEKLTQPEEQGQTATARKKPRAPRRPTASKPKAKKRAAPKKVAKKPKAKPAGRSIRTAKKKR